MFFIIIIWNQKWLLKQFTKIRWIIVATFKLLTTEVYFKRIWRYVNKPYTKKKKNSTKTVENRVLYASKQPSPCTILLCYTVTLTLLFSCGFFSISLTHDRLFRQRIFRTRVSSPLDTIIAIFRRTGLYIGFTCLANGFEGRMREALPEQKTHWTMMRRRRLRNPRSILVPCVQDNNCQVLCLNSGVNEFRVSFSYTYNIYTNKRGCLISF